MNRPVIIGASVCGLLLVGFVSRPTMWSGSDSPSIPQSAVTTGAVAQALQTDSRAQPARPSRPVTQMSGVELQQESEILWHRALEIQESLHQAQSEEDRKQMLDDFERILARYNAVQERLED